MVLSKSEILNGIKDVKQVTIKSLKNKIKVITHRE